ncbi:hypothetical protein [Novosphingobium album (ex Liu et al. 2023)]|uniref:DUF2384 domain-containing protein n=1 Tax=Novosphingobium album (ex Liu et al. 2023) TaxID=3031130 RepID=A0ABT5WSM3_9SPHN|nr:hypothetical protein [Novosphingobium album (ex Liu et al. 2023)]MDE8652995.1 hypothetical protein [Novosphingobium album (ex Liu et al. 2023)]
MTDAIDEEPKQIRRMGFRKSNSPKLAVDAAKRQGTVTRLAFDLLGGKDQAIAYLNTDRATLGGRPLDLAIASREGLTAVENDMRLVAGRPAESVTGAQ